MLAQEFIKHNYQKEKEKKEGELRILPMVTITLTIELGIILLRLCNYVSNFCRS
jgi:hypothetical protein